jgi:hypothetical protein
MNPFLFTMVVAFSGLLVAAVFSRICYAITSKITRAPALDFFISLFKRVPWAAGYALDGWPRDTSRPPR